VASASWVGEPLLEDCWALNLARQFRNEVCVNKGLVVLGSCDIENHTPTS
jgi:hypothetical protein